MKMWSAGLGTQELTLDFTKADFKREGDKVYITGVIVDPVAWEFKLTITKEDVPGLLHVMSSFPTLCYIARSIMGVSIFVRDKLILRRMGRKAGESPVSEE
ncbi:hypothetical protein ES703_12820 [subsurface metagenome]